MGGIVAETDQSEFWPSCAPHMNQMSFTEILGMEAEDFAAVFERRWKHWPAASLKTPCDLRELLPVRHVLELVKRETAKDQERMRVEGTEKAFHQNYVHVMPAEDGALGNGTEYGTKLWLPGEDAVN